MNNKTLGEIHIEAVNLLLAKHLIEDKPHFAFAAAVVSLIDGVILGDSKREIEAARKTFLEHFPDYAAQLTINGVTHAEVYKFAELDEKLEAAQLALSLAVGKPNDPNVTDGKSPN